MEIDPLPSDAATAGGGSSVDETIFSFERLNLIPQINIQHAKAAKQQWHILVKDKKPPECRSNQRLSIGQK